MDKLIQRSHELTIDSSCDGVAVGIIDFEKNSYRSFEVCNGITNIEKAEIYFDLASLTKPLTNSFVKIAENINDKDLDLVLNHRGGIPAWGLLSKSDWREQILSYPIKESDTLYSDFSALRFMLEIENQTKKSYQDLVFKNLDPDIKFWMDLEGSEHCLQNGFYHGKQNVGVVHDPNAFNLATFTSHAGLFGTVDGVVKSLIQFNKDHNLLDEMHSLLGKDHHRFINGFDTVSDPENTLAGKGCSARTFGHLGFTGTSFWIDTEKKLGHVILSNSTKYYWYDKKELNSFRTEIGQLIWKQ